MIVACGGDKAKLGIDAGCLSVATQWGLCMSRDGQEKLGLVWLLHIEKKKRTRGCAGDWDGCIDTCTSSKARMSGPKVV